MSAIRITRGDLFAEIMVDRRGPKDVWVFVVQREGMPDILAMDTCVTEAEARETAERALRQFKSRRAIAS